MASYKRVILVTGSNTGIGFEIVRSLAEKGHIVYLSARNNEAGLGAQDQLANAGLHVKFVQLDVTDPSSIAAAKDVIEQAEGRLDSLVHNAAISKMAESGGALGESIANIEEAFATNLLGVISVTQAFVPLLRRAPAGHACIVAVSTRMASNSLMASLPHGMIHSLIAYNTSKVAVNSYMISLAKELEGDVKVNMVSPGFVTTKLNGYHPGGKTPKQGADIIVPWVLLGPEEKDKTCLFWHENGALDW
ncbi:NAD(P)-binding protein [Hymenopellis radicata]|nr:NAD(P)-binding protein [Hymenopellis radicata]